MKHNKWIAILMAAAMLLSLCACGVKQPVEDNTPPAQQQPETPATPEKVL